MGDSDKGILMNECDWQVDTIGDTRCVETNDLNIKYTYLFVVHCSYTVMSWFSVQEEYKRYPFTPASVFILNNCNPEINMATISYYTCTYRDFYIATDYFETTDKYSERF